MENGAEGTGKLVVSLSDVNMNDIALVGGKNASLGELMHLSKQKIKVPDGFAVTSKAYWNFIDSNNLRDSLQKLLNKLDRKNFKNIETVSSTAKQLILTSKFPNEVSKQIKLHYLEMQNKYGKNVDVAVRSSATAEDLPEASFAGQHESYLNIRGTADLLSAILHCYASLFTARAIKYREDKGFDHMKIALSAGVQRMIRSDLGCAGVCFTLEPESGFRDIVHIAGSWGLGENVVKGNVNPDEFQVFKKTFLQGKKSIISRKLGEKENTLIYAERGEHNPGYTTVNTETSEKQRAKFILSDDEIYKIAGWAIDIENHYNKPMDIEWAKDGNTNEIFIVQARPETAHGKKTGQHIIYSLTEKGNKITSGIAVGSKIASGKARILKSPAEADLLKDGEILVTTITNPDWNVVMKKAAAVVTDKGGRTSHASIVARELGIAAVVGTNNATELIKDGQYITVSCAEGQEGNIYKGVLKFEQRCIDLTKSILPKTKVMLIASDPGKAFEHSFYPNNGVGLLRLEFIIGNSIKVHPMALVKYKTLKDADAKKTIGELTASYKSKENYFIEKLSESVAAIAAAFYPKDVIVRMSDFKTNEYANLIGGKEFEPEEENPMIGFRGASRYYNERYIEGFRLECEAMKRVRNEMGFTNVKLMIPFCRTVEEGRKVIEVMKDAGLKRGENGLEIYMMVEIPSNVLLADEFAAYFDGFSIGSNDLTQLTFGIDRDSNIINDLFDERNPAVKQLISLAIKKAKKRRIKIGLCGQAPSDYPEYASFLVEEGIDSISFNPDSVFIGIENIMQAEKKIKQMKTTVLN